MTNTSPDLIRFSDETADLAAGALRGYQIAEADLIDAGSEVLQAAGPGLVIDVCAVQIEALNRLIAEGGLNSTEITILKIRIDTFAGLAEQMTVLF